MSELPKGWITIPLEEISGKSQSINPAAYKDETFELYSVPSYSEGKAEIVQGSAIGSTKQLVEENDILLCKIVPHINRVWVVGPKKEFRQIASGEWILYRNHGCNPYYLRYCLMNQTFRLEFLKTVSGVGGSLLRARPAEVKRIAIPLPPANEQRRIVEKVDSLLARSARARDQLAPIPRLVERYKQAVLAKAFSGELTAEWRHSNRRYGNQNMGEFGLLPDSWKTLTLAEIAHIQTGLALGKKRDRATNLISVPYLRVANVQRGAIFIDEIKETHVTQKEVDKLALQPNDILMNEGGDRDKLGRGWVWEGQIPLCIHQNHVFRVRLYDQDFPAKLISYYANAFGQYFFMEQGKQTTNLASISKSKISKLEIPIPPIDEAKEILAKIQSAFAWIDRIAAEQTNATKLLGKLDQAVLAKAFRGDLVPQDPEDEPASVLLDRIRQERAAQPKAKRQPRHSSTKPQE